MNDKEFTLEKQRVFERLVLVEANLKNVMERLDRHGKNDDDILQRINSYIDKMNHIIIGNGKPGLVGDMDKIKTELKEKKDEATQNGYIAKVALAGFLLDKVWALVSHISHIK